MVVEADESGRHVSKAARGHRHYHQHHPEHLDHFCTFDAIQDAFRAFVENVPFYGFAVMCTDHPVVQTLVGKLKIDASTSMAKILRPTCDSPTLIISMVSRVFLFCLSDLGKVSHTIDNLTLPMPGRHNALNATGLPLRTRLESKARRSAMRLPILRSQTTIYAGRRMERSDNH